eukprot:6144834-Prymnesium_polylepis.1
MRRTAPLQAPQNRCTAALLTDNCMATKRPAEIAAPRSCTAPCRRRRRGGPRPSRCRREGGRSVPAAHPAPSRARRRSHP